MSEWAKITIDSSAEITMGQSPAGSTYNTDGIGMPLLNGPAEFGPKNPVAVQWTSAPTKICQPGDLLFCVRGSTTGRMNIANQSYCIGRGVAAIRGRAGVSTTSFLQLVLGGLATQILEEAKGNGSTFPSITGDRLRTKTFLLPPVAEQSRIAEVLSTLDKTIEQIEELVAKYRQIKVGLMHDLFTRGVMADGRLRPSRSEAPHLYNESPVGRVPNEWTVNSLRENACPGRAHLKTGPFGSSLKMEHWVEEGRPVITIGALGEGRFVESELLHVTELTAKALAEYQLASGDVVFSRVADVGRSAVITPAEVGWIMSSNLMRISVDSDRLQPAFLQAQLAHDSRVRTQIRTTVNSSGRDVANGQILNRLLFPRPPVEEQLRIMERVGALDSIVVVESERAKKLWSQRAGLMNDLLTGRVRVNVEEAVTA